jgi:dUTP pyrophosphatase
MNYIDVKVRLADGAYMPTRGHAHDAGLDLRAMEDCTIFEESSEVIDTGVSLVIPEGYAGLLVSKSGLNINNSVNTTGLIDADYTDTIRVRVYNDGDERLVIRRGDKVTQIMFVELPRVVLVLDEVQVDGERGPNAYGSTGR